MGAGTRFQRERGIQDDPELLYRYYMTVNQWSVMPSVARRLCHEAGPTIEWLNDRGVHLKAIIGTTCSDSSNCYSNYRSYWRIFTRNTDSEA